MTVKWLLTLPDVLLSTPVQFLLLRTLQTKRVTVLHGLTHLFEDFCEFGLGMELANEKMRARLVKVMNEAIAADCTPAEVKELFAEWINNMLDAEKTKELAAKIIPMVEAS